MSSDMMYDTEPKTLSYTQTISRLELMSHPGRLEGAKEAAIRDVLQMMVRDLRRMVSVDELPSPTTDELHLRVSLSVVPPIKIGTYGMSELYRKTDREFKREYLAEFPKSTAEPYSTPESAFAAEHERYRRMIHDSVRVPMEFIDLPKPKRKISIFEEELERLAVE
jgi:hypothetical protein